MPEGRSQQKDSVRLFVDVGWWLVGWSMLPASFSLLMAFWVLLCRLLWVCAAECLARYLNQPKFLLRKKTSRKGGAATGCERPKTEQSRLEQRQHLFPAINIITRLTLHRHAEIFIRSKATQSEAKQDKDKGKHTKQNRTERNGLDRTGPDEPAKKETLKRPPCRQIGIPTTRQKLTESETDTERIKKRRIKSDCWSDLDDDDKPSPNTQGKARQGNDAEPQQQRSIQ